MTSDWDAALSSGDISVLKIHEVEQGSDAWHAARCGLITASEMKLLMTPGTNKPANNDKSRAHLYELAAQRITRHVEPHYISDDMLRGHVDEVRAKNLYSEKYAQVTECGFMTRTWSDGFTLGFSPDGLVGDAGLVEAKSRRQKYQIETAVTGIVPSEYMLQIQTGMLVSGRDWCDFLSYCGGLPMIRFRVERDADLCERILECARAADAKVAAIVEQFGAACVAGDWAPTERVEENQEMEFDDDDEE